MEDAYTEMRHLSRSYLGNTWQMAIAGVELEGEEAVLAEVLKQHPEYWDVWEQANALPPDEEILRDGVNPFVHVMIHQMVENQVADHDPPQTAETLEAMVQAGYDRHDGVHAIGALITGEIFQILKNNRPFDTADYIEALRELAQTPRHPEKGPRSRQHRRRRSRRRRKDEHQP